MIRALALLVALAPVALPADSSERSAIVPTDWLVLAPIDGRGRRPFRPDAVFARYLLDPGPTPVVGESVSGERGDARWSPTTASPEGEVAGSIGYAFASVEAPAAGVYLADLEGASQLFVNGEGFVGDGYRYGRVGVPVRLAEGANAVFVTGVRGGFRLVLEPVDAASVVEPHGAVRADAGAADDARDTRPRLAAREDADRPLSTVFVEELSREGALDGDHEADLHRHVFRSRIDGSTQEYAVLPPLVGTGEAPSSVTRVIVSLHGASVPLMNQARAHSRHEDFWVLVPTNRRPYGFDWQDWGRLDAYEVMDDFAARHFERELRDDVRWYLVGHSMGGHGVWTLAANDLDRFEAVAPSAGWQGFDTYGGRPEGRLAPLWHGADGQSRTADLVANLVQLPIFVLHGADDRTVPASEARDMLALLRAAGAEPASHFEPGAGHWWDGERARGADCLEWPGVLELFRGAPERPRSIERADWTTVGPDVDARHHYLVLDQPRVYGEPVRIRSRFDPVSGALELRTENARRLRVRGLSVQSLEVDGEELDVPATAPIRLERTDAGWEALAAWPELSGERQKGAGFTGPFKRAFDHGFVLVRGTRGDDDEDAELLARARHDQQVWWYRANGVAPLVTDEELRTTDFSGRNVILYGNRDTNSAWTKVLGDEPPITAERGRLVLGDPDAPEGVIEGDAAALFVAPRRDSPGRLVGVFADTSRRAARLGYTFSPFVSGVGYPDFAVVTPDVLALGDTAVVLAGWFGPGWGFEGARLFTGSE